ncbi:MAG: hypothetical protein Q9181_004350 [Wetmoreana brouardii]
MPPSSWDTVRKAPLVQGNAPTRHIPRVTCPRQVIDLYSLAEERTVTQVSFIAAHVLRVQIEPAGLNSPPLILKNTHAFTAKEKPKLKLIYNKEAGSGADDTTASGTLVLATWVPEKAKKRKRKVPANSPAMATK